MFAGKVLLSLFALSSLALASSDAVDSGAHALNSRHNHRAHAHALRAASQQQSGSSTLKKRSGSSKKKRCVAKTTTTSSGATVTQTQAGSETTTKSTHTTTADSSSSTDSTGTSGPSGGIITVQEARCGDNGAVKKTTKDAGPNGSEAWLNCGVTGSGWKPPVLTMEDIVYVPLTTALEDKNSPFQECSKYLSIFQAAASKYNIPDILLASFALQESSCNPSERGGGGEVGMFQLSQDKCPGGKSSSECLDATTNTNIAAAYVSSQLKSYGNNLLQMIGEYNGWDTGMTVADAEKAKNSSCCRCQNNLDYLHQFMNGWMQNIDAYSVTLGTYQNLNSCPNDGANGRRMVRKSALSMLEKESIAKKRDLMGTPPNKWRF